MDYKKEHCVHLRVKEHEILFAAESILMGMDEQDSDEWVVRFLVRKYGKTPKDVTIKEFLERITDLARPECEEHRAMTNGYGGNVEERA